MNRAPMMLSGLLLLGACRPDPGAPRYPTPEAWDPTTDDPDFLPGDTPYAEGDERLSLGVFYEGGHSEILQIDEVTRHVYIYEGTFTIGVSDDRVEGLVSGLATVTGAQPWWGGGVHWDVPTDLSAWTTLHLAIASDDAAFSSWNLGMSDGITEATVDVADYGFVADGDWHIVTIPLDDLSGLDRSQISVALLIVGDGVVSGDSLQLDDLYLTKD